MLIVWFSTFFSVFYKKNPQDNSKNFRSFRVWWPWKPSILCKHQIIPVTQKLRAISNNSYWGLELRERESSDLLLKILLSLRKTTWKSVHDLSTIAHILPDRPALNLSFLCLLHWNPIKRFSSVFFLCFSTKESNPKIIKKSSQSFNLLNITYV